MITVTQATEKILNRSRYLTEAMSKNLINLSSLARYILPEVQELSKKQTSEAAILMALTRLSKKIQPHAQVPSRFTSVPPITIRSPLYHYGGELEKLLSVSTINPNCFYRLVATDTKGALFAESQINSYIPNLTTESDALAAITIQLPDTVLETPGAFYFFLKSLAWEQVTIYELFTQRNEFTIFVYEKEAEKAYSVIRSLFT